MRLGALAAARGSDVVRVATPNPIDAPGTGEAAWRAWPGLARLAVADLAGWASAVIVAAHPDDEILGVGGTMSLLASAGARLRLVAVTDGEASHPGARPDELAERRVAETAAGLRALGAQQTEVIRLRLPDTGLAGRQPELTALLRDLTSGFDICLAPWENDVHADHEAAGRCARRASQDRRASGHPASGRPASASRASQGRPLAFYPVWTWHWASPGDQRVPWGSAQRVPLPPAVAAAKRAAIGCFASQLEDRDGSGPVLTAGTIEHFSRDAEVLFPVRQP